MTYFAIATGGELADWVLARGMAEGLAERPAERPRLKIAAASVDRPTEGVAFRHVPLFAVRGVVSATRVLRARRAACANPMDEIDRAEEDAERWDGLS